MGLEKNNEQHYRQVVDKFADPSNHHLMNTREYVVRPVVNSESGSIMIILPAVADAKGRFYTVIVRTADDGETATIMSRGDSEFWGGDIVLNSAGDGVMLYSDGNAWFVLGTLGTPASS